MESQFYILLSLKSPTGFEDYGEYYLGNDREFASALFNDLRGSSREDQPSCLHMDFMEAVDELPVCIKSICCTLDDLAYNCKLIAKETFKAYNLKEASHFS
ncbi:MAG TPA: hypothetical protein VFE53_01535 [Mucilaginibacter sp.]|nr:hypothetical protein [Mucilaginibacter sp.]